MIHYTPIILAASDVSQLGNKVTTNTHTKSTVRREHVPKCDNQDPSGGVLFNNVSMWGLGEIFS